MREVWKILFTRELILWEDQHVLVTLQNFGAAYHINQSCSESSMFSYSATLLYYSCCTLFAKFMPPVEMHHPSLWTWYEMRTLFFIRTFLNLLLPLCSTHPLMTFCFRRRGVCCCEAHGSLDPADGCVSWNQLDFCSCQPPLGFSSLWEQFHSWKVWHTAFTGKQWSRIAGCSLSLVCYVLIVTLHGVFSVCDCCCITANLQGQTLCLVLLSILKFMYKPSSIPSISRRGSLYMSLVLLKVSLC